MAASGNQGDDDGMVSGINVTPLVDITLVLLIIFMVTAKLIVSQSLPLDLPKAANGQDIQMIFGVELHANGDAVVNGKKLANDDAVLPLAKEELARRPICAPSSAPTPRCSTAGSSTCSTCSRQAASRRSRSASPPSRRPAPPPEPPRPRPPRRRPAPGK